LENCLFVFSKLIDEEEEEQPLYITGIETDFR
jgi:hypothetical protein